jgi:phenylacetate-CoA ligase
MCELVAAASECEHGRMHLWPEAGVVEVLKDDIDEPAGPGESGRLICTGLVNADMPLVRYEVMDRAELSLPSTRCPCERSIPEAVRILGRCDDVILTADGRRLVQIDAIFTPLIRIREAQIVQEELDHFIIRVVPSEGWSEKDEKMLKDALIERVGSARVDVVLTRQIERTWAGKFRIIVSKVRNSRSVR